MFRKTRSGLYKTARTLGDISAIAEGKVFQRLLFRFFGRLASTIIRAIVRSLK